MEKTSGRWVYMPYCIEQLSDGRYIVLNRRYKPLGMHTKDWVTYETHPSAHQLKISPAVARKLSWNESADTQRIHLYGDSCVPSASDVHLRAYAERLRVLMELTIEVP